MKKIWLCMALASANAHFLPCPALAAGDPPGQIIEKEESISPFRVVPQASILMPTRFELSHSGYVVPYSEGMSGMPVFYLGLTSRLVSLGNWQISIMGRAGYAYHFGTTLVREARGAVTRETVQLSWIPFAGGVRLAYEIPRMSFLKPSVSGGGGTHFLHQSGDHLPLEASFWIPYLFVSPAVTFLEGGSDWFNGFTFGMTYQSTVSAVQFVRGWSFDLSVNLLF